MLETSRGCLIGSIFISCLATQTALAHERDGQDGLLDVIDVPLTDGIVDRSKSLVEKGLEISFSATQIYQQNTHGGISTHRRGGRYAGSYDLEMNADLDKLNGIEDASAYMLVEGSWPQMEGINDGAVGSYFGVNDDAGGARSIDVTELWFQQEWLDNRLLLRAGKIDLTGGIEHHGLPVSFDGSSYANNETSQFLNSALVNNPSIPFPDNGLAVMLYATPVESWYVSAAMADAQADNRETGFNSAFHDEDDLFYIAETGFIPQWQSDGDARPGAYRLGLWLESRDKERLDATGSRKEDVGFYVSFDQNIYRESAETHDTQGLGLFGRLGVAHSDVNQLRNFWSAGGQYQGIFDGRDDDVLALGVAQGVFSDHGDFATDAETAVELYYSAALTPWMTISPSLQYIINPGGRPDAQDALIVGLRAQTQF